MGLDLARVASDKKHYAPFLCKLCNRLASLDVVVTLECNHPFCRACLEHYVHQRDEEDLSCKCPACNVELEIPAKEQQQQQQHPQHQLSRETTIISDIPLRVKPLADAQPLAFECLKNVQVVGSNNDGDNQWVGDYFDYKKHKLENRQSRQMVAAGWEATTPDGMKVAHQRGGDAQPQNSMQPPRPDDIPIRGNGERVSSLGSMPSTPLNNGYANGQMVTPVRRENTDNNAFVDLRDATERCDKIKKQANAKFNRGDVEGARLLYSDGLMLVNQMSMVDVEVRKLAASLYSNRAVTYFRERILAPSIEDCDLSLELDPSSEKTYIRKWRALSAMGKFDEAMECLEEGLRHIPDSTKLQEEIRKSRAAPSATPSRFGSDPLDMSYSIASMSQFDHQTIASRANFGGRSGNANGNDRLDLDRAEKLKKQANAKFNKGDISAARALYTDALGCIPPDYNHTDKTQLLVAMLYSNRAVTFFRDKMFTESLDDCDKAIELDPSAEKSYIRKSRALVGLEKFSDACRCLEDAHQRLPDASKILEELAKVEKAENDEDDEIVTRRGMGGPNFEGSQGSNEFNNSVGSFKFYGGNAAGGENYANEGSRAPENENDYSEDLDLADKLKRNANAKFNRGDITGARLLYTEALACLPADRHNSEVRACLASLYANRAVTFFREREYGPSTWDCDKAIELDPLSEKSYIRKARALAAMSQFDGVVACLRTGLEHMPRSRRLDEELTKALEQQAEAAENHPAAPEEQDFQVSRGNLNTNANDTDGASSPVYQPESAPTSNDFTSTLQRDGPGLGPVDESKSEEFALPSDAVEDLERAEKLKKQANAKLNKGDVTGARVLYGEGLTCLPSKGPLSAEGIELAASLYANRAVTFFREKKFAATVMDCDRSLELDPKHEKSYIRKWRAYMALGGFDQAYACLETAVQEIPNSDRLAEELSNAKEQRNILTNVNQLIASGQYQEARDIVRPIIKTSDNVSLWLAAARADMCLGLTNSAMERVGKVLMFNPQHTEGLQVRGYTIFLSGEMEHGINMLKEAIGVDIDNDNSATIELLDKCNHVFSSFGKGQTRVKRGRYVEAVDLFTSAIEKHADSVPQTSPLYGLILTERAEALLLANQFEESLNDCNKAIEQKVDNMSAWTIKIEAFFALGRLEEARKELSVARRTWATGNDTIEEAYKKADFEMRLQQTDSTLMALVSSVETGTMDADGPERMDHRNSSNKGGPERESFRHHQGGAGADMRSPNKGLARKMSKANLISKNDKAISSGDRRRGRRANEAPNVNNKSTEGKERRTQPSPNGRSTPGNPINF